MHSFEYILKQIEDKMVDVQNALNVCETERTLLTKNLSSIKLSVEESFKMHMGTLQCRAKWLACHADSIFHLKDGSLSQQVAELELISDKLKSCLDASNCTVNERKEIKLRAETVLESASRVSLEPCETSSMSFIAYNDKMEEAIIGFGDIDAYDQSKEYDLLSDEGISVIEGPVEAIEMKMKSIEMQHLTAQSAKSEKEDFERIEIEVQPVSEYLNSDSLVVTSHAHQDDLAFDEGTSSGESINWLHQTSVSDKVEECDDIKSESRSGSVANCADVVSLWLKECEKSNPWVRRLISNTNKITPKGEALSASLPLSKGSTRPQKRKEKYTNMEHMDSIFLAPSSKFLRIEIERLDKSFSSLNSAITSLTLLENNETTMEPPASKSEIFKTPADVGDVNGISEASDSISLGGDRESVNSDSAYLLNPKLRSLDNEHGKYGDCSLTMRKNIAHINRILNTPLSSFHSEVNSLASLENTETALELPESHSESPINPEDVGDVNGILEAADSIFSTGDIERVISDSMNLLNSNDRSLDKEHGKYGDCSSTMRQNIVHMNSILNIPAEESLSEQRTDYQLSEDMHVSTIQSNIAHISRIFDIPGKEFLVVKDLNNLSTSFIKSTNAVNHMRNLETSPDEMFLRKTIDPEVREWLRGSSTVEQRGQCFDFDKCELNEEFEDKWIKTY